MEYKITEEQLNKYEKLCEYLKQLQSVAVAFSSGVDSTFLLKTARDVLGDNVVAVTAKSPLFPDRELNEAVAFCKKNNIKHVIFELEEFKIQGFADNPANRCYICKKRMFEKIINIANKNNITNVIEGSNADDICDYRPGMAAVGELNVLSPLLLCNMAKTDIRMLSKYLNIPTWEKPSFACLASRFVYGETITQEKLNMVNKAEKLLMDLGFSKVRVRIHGSMARIETVSEEIARFEDEQMRTEIVKQLKVYGFSYISLDLAGYRTGSMNETL